MIENRVLENRSYKIGFNRKTKTRIGLKLILSVILIQSPLIGGQSPPNRRPQIRIIVRNLSRSKEVSSFELKL